MLAAEHQAGDQAKYRGLSGALGKLEIRWRSSSAALGRLQTQQIMASATAQKDTGVTVHSLSKASASSQSTLIFALYILKT